MKEHLRGKRFADNNELKAVVNGYFRVASKEFFQSGIEKLRERYNKCIVKQGDCVKKLEMAVVANYMYPP